MVNNVVLTAALRNTLNSIQKTQGLIEDVTRRLATGRRVNSALDQPQNFFQAQSLKNTASDYDRLLDGIGQSLFTIREGLAGVAALEKLLNQADAIATESQAILAAGDIDPALETVEVNTSPTPLSAEIQSNNPVAYWRLNETAGTTAVNLGSGGAAIDGTYVNGVSLGQAPLYTNSGDTSADFNGSNQRVNIPDSALINLGTYPERTIELVFNADSTAGRQVLYEEGATVNSLTIYIDNGLLYITGRDQGDWGPLNINTAINPGETYHLALVFDQPNDTFTGYVNGVDIGSGSVNGTVFPSHSGDIAIGAMRGGAWFHDGSQGGNGNYFDGRISDVAVYNTALSDTEILQHANSLNATTTLQYRHADFENVMDQVDRIVLDAHYRGVNLLAEDNLTTFLNPRGSSRLVTEGVDFSADGLGVKRFDFNVESEIALVIESVRDALERVRDFGAKLVTDLNIIATRRDFTERLVNNHEAGADDLTVADQNEEGANLLAAQTREALGTTALSLAAQSQASILEIIGR